MKRETSLAVALAISGVLGCTSRPAPLNYPVWQTWEDRTPAFRRDREYIRTNCELLKREESPQELRSTDDLRERAPSLGANTIVVEKVEGGKQERTSFYNCLSLPSSAVQGPTGPAH